MKKSQFFGSAFAAFVLALGVLPAQALAEEDDIVFLYPEYNPLYAERWEGWNWDGLAERVCTERGVALDLGLSREYQRAADDDDIIFLYPEHNPYELVVDDDPIKDYWDTDDDYVGTGRELLDYLRLTRAPSVVIDGFLHLVGGDLQMPVLFLEKSDLLPERACAATRGELIFLANAAAKKGAATFILPDGTRVTANATAPAGTMFLYADEHFRGAVFVYGPLACR